VKYSPEKEKMVSQSPDKGFSNLVNEFYSRIGQQFPIKWDKNQRPALPQIEKENLPSDVSMSDVETVLNNMKADGWF